MRQEMHDLVLSSRGETFHTVRWKWRQSRDKGKKGSFKSSKLTLSNANTSCFFLFGWLSSFVKKKVDLGWCKTEICLFPPLKAKTTLYPQPKSFLPLLTPPLQGKKIDGWSHCTRGFRSVPAIHPWVSQKQEKSLKFICERSQGTTTRNQQT